MGFVASVASKLQIKPGPSVCVIGLPRDVTLDMPVRQIAIDDVWPALRLRPA
jgi:hypothetical protein